MVGLIDQQVLGFSQALFGGDGLEIAWANQGYTLFSANKAMGNQSLFW